MKKTIVFFYIFFILSNNFIYAHSGKTDANGGHYNNSTGEYHFHHGYAAHQHINGVCPYEDKFEDLLPNTCPKCQNIVVAQNGNYCFECGYELLSYPIKLVSGDDKKTREEYFEETQELKNKIKKLETTIDQYNNDLKKANVNSISELNEELKKKKTDISNLKSGFLITLIIGLFISYNIGSKNKRKIILYNN